MNIYDIAAESGVSIATVSRVLNDSPGVRPQTRERVLAVMRQAGYRPNAFARGLGRTAARLVKVISMDLQDPLYTSAVSLVEKQLRARGMTAVLCCMGEEPTERQTLLTETAGESLYGVLFIGADFSAAEEELLAALARKCPVVMLHGAVSVPGVFCVSCDERQAVQELVEGLARRQKRNVLFLHDRRDSYSNRQKLEGYRAGCAACGMAAEEKRLVSVEPTLDTVNDCVKRLLVQGVSFDAVIGATDLLALAAQKALQRIGLTIPVIGFNNSWLSRCSSPELTSVDNELAQMCAVGLDVLEAVLAGREASPHTVLSARLVERDSFRFQ